MNNNLETLYDDGKVLIRKLSYKKILVEYNVPLFFGELQKYDGMSLNKPILIKANEAPLETLNVKMRYQANKDNKSLFEIKGKSLRHPINCISGRNKIKMTDIHTVYNKTVKFKLNDVEHTLDMQPIEYYLVGVRAHSVVREKQINQILS